MAKRKAQEIHNQDESELLTNLAEAKADLFKLRFQVATGQQDNTAQIREIRKTVARINTVLREREIEAAEAIAAGATTAGDNA